MGAVAYERRLELLQQLALLRSQIDRSFDHDATVKVAGAAAAHRFNALLAQPENLAGLGFERNADFGFAAKGWHAQRISKRCLRESDRHLAVKIIAVSLEDGVLPHADLDVKVACGRAGRTRFALTGQPDAVAIVDTCRNFHRQDFLFFDATGAAAGFAGIAEFLSATAAVRARLLHRENAALEADLTAPLTGGAAFDFSVLGAAAFARPAADHRRHFDALVDARDRILKVKFDHITDIGAAPWSARTATTMPVGPKPGNVFGQGKNMPQIAMAHEIPYVATATVADLRDLEYKVKKAMTMRGARYIHIFVPCPLGWGSASQDTILLARLARESGFFPVFEAERGEVPGVSKLRRQIPIEDYLKPQKRFAHLFGAKPDVETIARLQAIADRNIRRYGLLNDQTSLAGASQRVGAAGSSGRGEIGETSNVEVL